MSVIDIHTTILVYGDGEVPTSNPKRRFVDWTRHLSGESVEQPSVREYVVQPGETLSIFSGTRNTSIDGTTAFDLSLNSTQSSVYRMTASGGTAPAFRTARAYDGTGVVHTLTINNNATLVVDIASGSFTAAGVQVGDTVFIPGTTTGDSASPFNINNLGFWVVLAVAATRLTMRRHVGEDFNGTAEEVTPTAASEFKIFSASGVQRGDSMEISAGFSSVSQKSFVVSEVTDEWVEFTSTEDLPLETDVTPGAVGITFYSDAKRFIRVEVDQEAVVRLNGDTGNSNRLSPRTAGDVEKVAHFEKWGPCWELAVVNRSSASSMVVNIISVE